MLYRDLSTDSQIEQLLAGISNKITSSEKKGFLKSPGVAAVDEIYNLDEQEKSKIAERFFQERARRLTVRDVSFRL